MGTLQAFDWVVFALFVAFSGWIGLVLTRWFVGLVWGMVGFSGKIGTIVDVLYERVKRIQAAR